MPKRFSTELVSIVCSAGTSTRSSECEGLNGMAAAAVVCGVSVVAHAMSRATAR